MIKYIYNQMFYLQELGNLLGEWLTMKNWGGYSQEIMGLILRRVLVFEEVIVLHRQNYT